MSLSPRAGLILLLLDAEHFSYQVIAGVAPKVAAGWVVESTELLFSQFWRLKPKIKVSTGLVSLEASLLGLQMAISCVGST